MVDGSLGPGSAISEITAVSVGRFLWQPHGGVSVQMEEDRDGGGRDSEGAKIPVGSM